MRTAAFVVARNRAFNLVQSTPARLRDLAKLFAILREIGFTACHGSVCACINVPSLPVSTLLGGTISSLGGVRRQHTDIDPNGQELSKQMPWRPLGRMDDEELAAVYEYLTHLPGS